MINKKELNGKYVTYYDKDSKLRVGKVRKITGNYLTIVNANGIKRRIYRDKIVGRQFPKKGIDEIEWK